jgi:hypothetical protein
MIYYSFVTRSLRYKLKLVVGSGFWILRMRSARVPRARKRTKQRLKSRGGVPDLLGG